MKSSYVESAARVAIGSSLGVATHLVAQMVILCAANSYPLAVKLSTAGKNWSPCPKSVAARSIPIAWID